METIFKISKKKPLIKFKVYKYLGTHVSSDGLNYYIRKYDNHNNYEFMAAQIVAKMGFIKKYMLASGTSIKVIDPFMFSYLKHRKDKSIKRLLKTGFVEASLEENGFKDDKTKLLYSKIVPGEIAGGKDHQELLKQGFDTLYVKNTEVLNKKFNTVTVVMYQEVKQEALGWDLSYVVFTTTEYATKPSYVSAKGKEKYAKIETHTLAIPVDLLK